MLYMDEGIGFELKMSDGTQKPDDQGWFAKMKAGPPRRGICHSQSSQSSHRLE